MSGKCNLVDQTTFNLLQQSRSDTSTSGPFRRSRKFGHKRIPATSGIDLTMYVKANKPLDAGKRNVKDRARGTGYDSARTKVKRCGKQREDGAKQTQSRLKKAILRYRQNKASLSDETPLDETTSQLQELTVDNDETSAEKNKATKLHSRKFREYCNTCCTAELKEKTESLLRELNRFQRRAYAKNEIKARGHKRFVLGFRQVQNYLRINKVRLVVIATDCEKCEGEEAGLDETISNVKAVCQDQNVPIAFPFERRKLAYILFKKASISCVGILDYDGAREIFAQLLLAIREAQECYDALASSAGE